MFSGVYDYSKRSREQYPPVPVHTSQMAFEILSLVKVYSTIKPMRVVEIGVQYGGTLWHWLTNAEQGATVVGIDWWNKNEMVEDPRQTWESWVPEGVNFHSIIGDTHKVTTKCTLMEIVDEIDFLFIDGDHTYEGVKQDWLMYGPLVRKGGIIAFHDLIKPEFSPHIGVGQLWREIQRAGYMTQELYALPENEQKWGGIGVVVK